MGRFLSLLIFFFSTSTAFADWPVCVTGEAPKVRGAHANVSGLEALIPDGDLYPAEVEYLVSSYAASCVAPATMGPTSCSSNDSNNTFTCSKYCTLSNGNSIPTYISGSRVCGTHSCPLEVGSIYPGPSAGESFCYQACEIHTTGIGLTINSAADQSVLFSQVVGDNCTLDSWGVIDSAQRCENHDGHEFCTSPGSQRLCAQIDGAEWCISESFGPPCDASGNCSTQENPVVALDNGAQVAPASTPSPPAPDTGIPGEVAPPDMTVTATAPDRTQTYSYWSPSTVAGSSFDNPGGNSDGGDGEGIGAKCGADGQDPCEVELVGDFDAPDLPDDGVPTFTEALNSFFTRLQASPIGSAFQTVAASIPEGGSPPSGTITLEALGNAEITLTPPPEVIDAIVPVLSIVMILVWSLIAIVTFLEG